MLRAARAVHRCGGLACDANFSSLDLSKRTVVDASTSLRLAECVSTGRGHRLQLGRSGKAMAGRQLTASSKPVASGMPCVECRSACGGSGPPATAAGTQECEHVSVTVSSVRRERARVLGVCRGRWSAEIMR
eukprot:3732751-Prymnesium_polylepis.1